MSGILGGSKRAADAVAADNVGGEVEDLLAGDLAFLAAVPDRVPIEFKAEPGGFSSLAFYSAAGSRTAWGQVATPLHLVTYSVRPLPDGSKGLFREEKPLVETRDAYYDLALLVAGGVSAFKVEGSDGQRMRDAWPDQGAGELPALVRVYLDILRADGTTDRLYVESAPPVEAARKPLSRPAATGPQEPATIPTGGRPKPTAAVSAPGGAE